MNHQANTFPQEVWMEILKHCAQQTLVILSRVSPLLCTEARKSLLRTVVSKPYTDQQNEHMGIIHRPWAFHELLAKDHVDWRQMITSVKLYWLNEYIDKDGNDALVGRDKPFVDHLAYKTALLLCECTQLQEFHMNAKFLPVVTNLLKTRPLPATTLEFYLPHHYTWENLYAVFNIPTLVNLKIRNLLSPDRPSFRFPPVISDELHNKIATSNVQDLSLTACGPLTRFISPLFRWPSNLRKLKYRGMRSRCEPYWRTIRRRTGGDISDAIDLSVQLLWPLIPTLQELDFNLGLGNWISAFQTGPLFQPFTSLKHLTAPIELVMHSRGLSRSRTALPFYTNLPHHLETLELKFTMSTSWHSLSDLDPDACLVSDPAHKLFDELSTIAMQKGYWFTKLRQLTLSAYKEIPFLVKCEHAEATLEELDNSGVKVVQGDWYRESREDWV
jgi:hypothetical protein